MRPVARSLRILMLLVVTVAGCESTGRKEAARTPDPDYRQEQADRMTERDVQRTPATPRRQPLERRDQRRQNVIDQPR